VTECFREPVAVFVRLPTFVFVLADWQIPECVENKALLLVLAGRCILRTKIERTLGLLIEVGSIVECFRKCVARLKRHLLTHPPVERE